MDIDRKFVIRALSRAHGTIYTEEEGVFFKACDTAFNTAVLDAYKRECINQGAHPRQIQAVELLIERVRNYKSANPAKMKIADVDEGEESERVNRPNES